VVIWGVSSPPASPATHILPLPPPLPLQVFDVRMQPRMLTSVPFAPGPSLLTFHPKLRDTLLVGSAGGVFMLASVPGSSLGTFYQVCVRMGGGWGGGGEGGLGEHGAHRLSSICIDLSPI
jgi:hypothetical protein